jgi:hypothetical protein
MAALRREQMAPHLHLRSSKHHCLTAAELLAVGHLREVSRDAYLSVEFGRMMTLASIV